MDTLQWVLAACLGLGLATAIGLNTSLPLLMLAIAAHFHVAGLKLGDHYAWLSSGASLAVLGVASVLEFVGDKIPVVDHAMHAFGLFVRPVAGALATASVFVHADPTTAAVVGLIVGGPTSFGFHAAASGLRVASSATTLGCANPLLSTLQDFAAAAMVFLSLWMPLLVPFVVVIAAASLWKVGNAARHKLTFK